LSSFGAKPHQRLTLQRSGFAVIDAFLAAKEFAFLRQALSRLEYRVAGSDYVPVGAAWSPEELRPLESRPYDSSIARDTADPVSVALALFVDAIGDAADLVGETCGLSSESARSFSLRSYLYPQSVSLNWHSDAGKGGAFTYYYHDKWHRRWGGELLIADPALRPTSATSASSDEARQPPIASEDDDGYLLRPLPNRLVIVRSGTAHKIAPVSRAAGAHCRRSLTGFFAADEAVG
jgi:hypothetical protein